MRRVVVSVVVAGVVVVRDRNRMDKNNYLRQENWGAKGEGKKRPKAIKKKRGGRSEWMLDAQLEKGQSTGRNSAWGG